MVDRKTQRYVMYNIQCSRYIIICALLGGHTVPPLMWQYMYAPSLLGSCEFKIYKSILQRLTTKLHIFNSPLHFPAIQ